MVLWSHSCLLPLQPHRGHMATLQSSELGKRWHFLGLLLHLRGHVSRGCWRNCMSGRSRFQGRAPGACRTSGCRACSWPAGRRLGRERPRPLRSSRRASLHAPVWTGARANLLLAVAPQHSLAGAAASLGPARPPPRPAATRAVPGEVPSEEVWRRQCWLRCWRLIRTGCGCPDTPACQPQAGRLSRKCLLAQPPPVAAKTRRPAAAAATTSFDVALPARGISHMDPKFQTETCTT
mmetsp:Transcript_81410/g.253055  ORF Transcript_81410/g.253055 Transcript_81410/m.253055 type:complete len:236 (-) Transcript_81410:4-711(-)